MTVRDLYIYSRDGHTFILFKEGATKSCFKGSLEDCPTELIDKLVYQFRAIDFNTIEVVLIGKDIENMKMERIFYYTELSKIINETNNLIRFCNRTNNGNVKYYYYNAINKLIDNYFDNGRISCDAYEYFRKRVCTGYWL